MRKGQGTDLLAHFVRDGKEKTTQNMQASSAIFIKIDGNNVLETELDRNVMRIIHISGTCPADNILE